MRTGFYSWRRAAHLVAAAAPTPGTRSFIPRSISLFFRSLPLFSLPLITTTIITSILSTFDHSSPRSQQPLFTSAFFSPSNLPFVSLCAGHYRYPSAFDPFRSRFFVSQVPTLTPLENQNNFLPGSVSRYLPPTRLHSFLTTIQTV